MFTDKQTSLLRLFPLRPEEAASPRQPVALRLQHQLSGDVDGGDPGRPVAPGLPEVRQPSGSQEPEPAQPSGREAALQRLTAATRMKTDRRRLKSTEIAVYELFFATLSVDQYGAKSRTKVLLI